MTAAIFTELAWLPRPPADFSAACRALAAAPIPGMAIQALAAHALDTTQSAKLGRVIARAVADGRSLTPLQPLQLGLLGNGTLDLRGPALAASAARHGFALDVVQASCGQVAQEALDPDSPVNRARPDLVLLAIDHRGFALAAPRG